jgi:mono/diheme cytochrome c family protein
MKRLIVACAFVVLLVASPSAIRTQPATQSAGEIDQHRALVSTYCATCHSDTARLGGLALEGMDLDDAADDAETWEKAIRKLRGRLMPPPGSPQPEQAAIDSLVGWLEDTIDANPSGPRAGHVPIQRLNRTEYVAAVKDLVGVEVAPDVLPQDIAVDGFDNIAATLTVSPAFVDQYMSAARSIARRAVGGEFLESVRYALSQNRGREGMPLGLRDGLMFEHYFPADGEYRVTVLFPDQTVGLYTGRLENENTLVIMVDGQIQFREPIGGLADLMLNHREAGDGRAQIQQRFTKVPIQVEAGVHDVVVGFIERSQFESTANAAGGGGGNQPGLGDVEIVGPYDVTGVSSPSRELIYVCDPQSAGEAACARQIAESLATRAYRRPATADDLGRLLPFFEAGREEGGDFDRGVERLVMAVLVSPDFLYRAIRAPGAASQEAAALSDLELASRLSFFIWSAGPDRELLDLAIANRLTAPGEIDRQVARMLADPKASSLVSSFAMKWLRLSGVNALTPDPEVFPGFDRALPGDFLTEVELFIRSVLLEDRSILELLTSEETYLNDRLARHYGIGGVTGSQFRKFRLTDEARFGLLGKGAVLMSTSYANRTSPVLRGAWVLERLLGTPPTPPPPNVEAFPDNVEGAPPRTVRARLEQHRASPTCGQCHGVIDPIGLALENFDGIGRWRTADAETPIDASTVLPSGAAIDGPVELRRQLVARPDMFAQVVTEKLMMYALGRELEYFDMPQVRAVVREAANEDYKWSSVVRGVVRTDAFRMQGPAHEQQPVAAASN